MKIATLKISKLTDRLNGYGMPIVEVISDNDIKVINRGYNEFEAQIDIDETDLLRLRTMFNTFSVGTVMLEISTPTRKTNCWYRLDGENRTCIIW